MLWIRLGCESWALERIEDALESTAFVELVLLVELQPLVESFFR